MTREVRLPVDIDFVRHPTQFVLRFTFQPEALCDWCVSLCLLKEQLITSFTLTEQRTKASRVEFLTQSKVSKIVQVGIRSNQSQIVMTGTALEYLQHFFLKYYRDGLAEVDHVDLQATDVETGKEDIYLTFRVPDYRAPITANEARKRLENSE